MSLCLVFLNSGNSICFGRSLPIIWSHLTAQLAAAITNKFLLSQCYVKTYHIGLSTGRHTARSRTQ
jgi:hypothetical protein